MRIQSHVERIKFLTKAAEEQEARRKEAAEKEVATV